MPVPVFCYVRSGVPQADMDPRVLFGQDCEVLILHSLFEEMKMTNLEVEYLKGWKGLEGIGYL